jgi:valyl-tRNA synthetase
LETIEGALERYHFNVYADALYDFIWRDVCDRYLEAVKPTIDDDPRQQAVLAAVLDAALRLLHPVSPFVTEALFPHVQAVRSAEIAGVALGRSELAATAAWPSVAPGTVEEGVVDTFERADKLVAEIRAIRAARQVKPKQQISLHGPTPILGLITEAQGTVETLAGLGEVTALTDDNRPAIASPLAFEGSEILLSGLVDELDVEAERARLTKVADGKAKQVESFEKRLANPNYVNKAKPELVAETRELLEVARHDLEAAQAALAALAE